MLELECTGHLRRVTPKVVDEADSLQVVLDLRLEFQTNGVDFLRQVGLSDLNAIWNDAGVPWSSAVKHIPLDLKIHNVGLTINGQKGDTVDLDNFRLYPEQHHQVVVACRAKGWHHMDSLNGLVASHLKFRLVENQMDVENAA